MNEKIKLERVKSMRAVYFHALSETPESDAWEKAESWAERRDLLKKESDVRIFGRNTYPTKDPEPHGYGYFITITPNISINEDLTTRIIPGGLYAVLRCEGVEQIGENWADLWNWVDESEYKFIGEIKGEFGYELGFEEHLNWYPTMVEKSEGKLIFNLMLQLWEK
ncbi:MAG: GyrI-like domain-containing protein [Candidatus Odinarchaeota archaeon]